MQKKWFTVFNIKVTARAYVIKIWLFLLYLLKCWSVCNQTWFDSTAIWAGVSYGEMGVLHSRSSLQQKFKMLVNVWLDNIFWTTEQNLVWLCSIISQSVVQKIWFTVFNVKVTARLYIIKTLQWGAADTEIKSHLVRAQSLNVLPLKPAVGQHIAIHATLIAGDFFLISTFLVHSPAFFPKPLPIFSCIGCG